MNDLNYVTLESLQAILSEVLPQYQVLSAISSGSYGQVFTIKDELGALAAVKCIPLLYREELSVKRKPNWDWLLLQRHLSSLRHHRLVGIRGLFTVLSPADIDPVLRYGIVLMDYWPETLESYIKRITLSQSVDFTWQLNLLGDILASLISMKQSLGFVYTDLKPSNILVHAYGDHAVNWVLGDLGGLQRCGVASYHRSHLPPRWLAPEVFDDKKSTMDDRALLFTFAALAFFVIEGRYPIDDKEDGIALRTWLIDHAVLNWSETDHPSLQALQKLINQCVCLNPNERVPDFESLLSSIRVLLKHYYQTQYETLTDIAQRLFLASGLQFNSLPSSTYMVGQQPAENVWLYQKYSEVVYQEEFSDELPSRLTKIGGGYLSITPVTVAAFSMFVAETGYISDAEKDGVSLALQSNGHWDEGEASWRSPGFQQKADHPVVCVSWFDACAYCNWLSFKTGLTCRLPTEVEWEAACHVDPIENDAFVLDINWNSAHVSPKRYELDSETQWDRWKRQTAPVCSRSSNALGFYDLQGNVWEWCLDSYYTQEDAVDGRVDRPWKVRKGGSWRFSAVYARPAYRRQGLASASAADMGFRVFVEC